MKCIIFKDILYILWMECKFYKYVYLYFVWSHNYNIVIFKEICLFQRNKVFKNSVNNKRESIKRYLFTVFLTNFLNQSNLVKISFVQDVREIWLQHLSPHLSPGLIWLMCLVRWVSPSSFTAPCASLKKLHAQSKRMNIPDRGGPFFGQGYASSCAFRLELSNKLSKSPSCSWNSV